MKNSPRRVTWVYLASGTPMGQQYSETGLQQAVSAAAGSEWSFTPLSVASIRSTLVSDARVPFRLLERSPLFLAAAAGRALYGSATLFHRFDLRLPPRLGRELVSIHDFSPLRFADEGRLPSWWLESVRRAIGIICPSEFTAAEVRSTIGPVKTWVVPNGVHAAFGVRNPMSEAELAGFGLAPPFILHAGGATRRKNLDALVAAWRLVAHEDRTAMLALCGPPDRRRDVLLEGVPRARFVGRMPLQDLTRLMQAAAAVVVPSLYEGFGLPALEGMAAGVPVVAASCSALPEVCGDAALLVEPTADGLAQGMVQALAQTPAVRELTRRGPLRAQDFSWRVAAERCLQAYEEALELL